jgi:hypothetical protein
MVETGEKFVTQVCCSAALRLAAEVAAPPVSGSVGMPKRHQETPQHVSTLPNAWQIV